MLNQSTTVTQETIVQPERIKYLHTRSITSLQTNQLLTFQILYVEITGSPRPYIFLNLDEENTQRAGYPGYFIIGKLKFFLCFKVEAFVLSGAEPVYN